MVPGLKVCLRLMLPSPCPSKFNTVSMVRHTYQNVLSKKIKDATSQNGDPDDMGKRSLNPCLHVPFKVSFLSVAPLIF